MGEQSGIVLYLVVLKIKVAGFEKAKCQGDQPWHLFASRKQIQAV
jgi:hypothetical protein